LASAREAVFPARFEDRGVVFERRQQAAIKARVFFTVCDAALYLPADVPSREAVSGNVPKSLEILYHYDIDAEDFVKAADLPLARGLTPAQLRSVREPVAAINRLYRRVEKGDRYLYGFSRNRTKGGF
jgi:hypothetical protein